MSGFTRNQRDPFWATALSKMDSRVAEIVRGIQRVVEHSEATKAHVWPGSGWRTGSKEHQSGRAIDIMFVPDGGTKPTVAQAKARDALVAWLLKHGKALNIQWVLVSRDGKPRTESFNFDRGTWKALANRGSISANHVDHVHVYFKTSARWLSRLDNTTMGGKATSAPSSPGLPSTGLSGAQRGDDLPLLYNAENHPRGSSHGERVRQLQEGMNRVFPAYRSVTRELLDVDGWFGKDTDAWVREFQRRTHLTVDGIVGQKTLERLQDFGILKGGKSIREMAEEVIAGKHGNGHANRQRSLGVDDATYKLVRAEVNRRV